MKILNYFNSLFFIKQYIQRLAYLFLLILLIELNLLSQDPCGLNQVMQGMLVQNPEYQSTQMSQGNAINPPCAGAYEIPLVFHILHDNGPENVSDAQIFEAISQLNSQFAGAEGGYNTQISFYLANKDPNGKCTNGINRIQTSTPGVSPISYENDVIMKNLSRWPAEDYLNVWIVKYIDIGGIGGYSYFPPVPSNVDGVVIHNMNLGTTGTAIGNAVNTLAHEIGHYLKLYHLWGREWFYENENRCIINCDHVDCSISGDMVCDTDPMKNTQIILGMWDCNTLFPSDCEDCPDFPTNTYFYNMDNYMSYVHHCQDKFTEGQAQRMCNAINDYRAGLTRPQLFGCNNECDYAISTNTTFNTPISFWGNINIKSGATLTINSDVEFGQEKAIIIENGGKLIIQNNATLDKCPQATYWKGIYIETGGELFAYTANINNAQTGITADNYSKLFLELVSITGLNNQFGQGILLQNGVNATKLNRLKIKNYLTGFNGLLGQKMYEITNSEISNVDIGIFIMENILLLSETVITNSNTGVYLWNATGSVIENNQIGYTSSGIRCIKSRYTSIVNNTIGWPTQRGKMGIYLNQSGGSAISNNTQIQSTKLGVGMWGSDVLVDHNSIDVFGQNNMFGGGIQNNRSNGSQITQNFIGVDHSVFGIETVESNGTDISNNYIDHFSTVSTMTAAIRSMGSMDDFVEENVISGLGNTTGMIAQNSMGNHYLCNIINNTYEGLGVYYNSEEQEIKGNEFDAWIDLAIRSAVGLQPHHGNKFLGGSARANELSLEERINSQFKANPNIPSLWPSDIQPNDGSWWVGEPNLNHYTCDGSYGPGWVPFGGDPNKLCAYWNYLKSIQASKPELFFIKLYHLLKYSKTKTGYNLPNCIKLDPVFLTLCGLTKLVDVSVALDNIGKVNTNTSTLPSLQAQYAQEQTEAGRTVVKNQIATEILTIAPSIDADRNQDSVRLDSIETELNTINCTQIIVAKWKEILKLYVKFLRQGEVAQNDRSALLTYSADCSDLYGDAIHLARAMANTFDNTYFDTYDGCLQEVGPRSQRDSELSELFNIFPNPTSGKVYLQLPLHYNGRVEVYNVDGRLMSSLMIVNSNINEIDLSDLSGVYYVHLRSIDGDILSKKIIVLK
jgi:hypothetical protein